ncbi:hypothetical protein EPN95_02100 [Patescibacteria group bacterium]|nr:MAG: hypothetical protein EPN95_02100 [Patescibacteria group bacterium]
MTTPPDSAPDSAPTPQNPTGGHNFLKTAAQAARRHMQESREKRATLQNEAMLAARRQEFQEMLAHATGINKQALEIIQTANEIPTKSTYGPLGTTWTDADGNKRLQQARSFSFGENPQDPSPGIRTPLVQDNGTIIVHLDSYDWSHNGFRSPLQNATITVETPFTEDASGNRQYGATESDIKLNDQPYDPDTLVLDYDDNFTGKIQGHVNGEGHMTVERSSSSTTGMVKMKPEDITFDVAGILDKLHSAVASTVLAYREIADQATIAPDEL